MSKRLSKKLLNIGMMAMIATAPACNSEEATVIPGQVADYKYPTPAPQGGELRSDILRVRISNSLFNFITSHLGNIMASVAGSVDSTTIPGKQLVAFDLGGKGVLNMDISKLNQNTTFSFAQGPDRDHPARLNVVLTDIDLYGSIEVDDSCKIVGNSAGLLANVDSITFALDVGVKKNSAGLSVLDLVINSTDSKLNLGMGAIKGTTEGSGFVCGTIKAGLAVGNIILSGADLFSDMFMPELIKFGSEKLSDALGDIPLEVVLGLNIPGLIANSIGNEDLAAMWAYPTTFGAHVLPNSNPLRITQTGSDSTSAGLSVVMDAAFGAVKSDCIGEIPPPQYLTMTTTLPDYNGVVDIYDGNGFLHPENYDALVTVSQATIAQLLYGVIRSGAMCVKIDSDSLGALVGGTLSPTVGLFSTFAPELSYLAPANAPVIISLRPTTAPVVNMGTGNVALDDKGQPVLDEDGHTVFDSLVGIEFNQLELNFFLFTENRYARMFTLLLDVKAGLTLVSNSDAQLGVSVDKLSIDHFVTTFNDLAPHANLDEFLNSILDTLMGTFLSQSLKFDVNLSQTMTTLFGQPVDLFFNDIRREPLVPNPDLPGHYLAVYATFCDENDRNNKNDLACYRAGHNGTLPEKAAQAKVAIDNKLLAAFDAPQSVYGFELTGRLTGKLALDVTGGYEYSYKIDNGPWYSYRQPNADGQLVIKNGIFRLAGLHQVQLKARAVGGRSEVMLDTIEVMIDNTRPQVFSQLEGENLHIWATDLNNELPALQIRDNRDGSWTTVENLSSVVSSVKANNSTLEARAIDASGNSSKIYTIAARDLTGSVVFGEVLPCATGDCGEKDDGQKGGCNAAGNGSALALMALLALLIRKKIAKN